MDSEIQYKCSRAWNGYCWSAQMLQHDLEKVREGCARGIGWEGAQKYVKGIIQVGDSMQEAT